MKIPQKVLNKYPKAKIYSSNSGYFVGYEMEDGNVFNILSELLLPNQETKEKAWECALLSIKTTQNFNRTHPLKVDMYSDLEKRERTVNRKIKGKINKEKFNDDHIYY